VSQIFVDSSAWFIVADKRNERHAAASKFLRETKDLLITSNLVFAETLSLMTKRLGKGAALAFGQKIRSTEKVRIIHLDAAMEEIAWRCFERYRDKAWDFVDCSSFALMDSLKLARAFTFDMHFAQKGFDVLPGA
jgi:predicted nucleic acid-binding protein